MRSVITQCVTTYNKIKFKLNRAKKLICSYISTISQCGSLHHIEIMCAKSHRLVYFFKQFRCCASIWSVKSSLVIIFFFICEMKEILQVKNYNVTASAAVRMGRIMSSSIFLARSSSCNVWCMQRKNCFL